MASGDKFAFGEFVVTNAYKVRAPSIDSPREAVVKLIDNEVGPVDGPIYAVAPPKRTFQISNPGNATVHIEVTNDPNFSEWKVDYVVSTGSTMDFFEMDAPWQYIRAVIDDAAAGGEAVTVLMAV